MEDGGERDGVWTGVDGGEDGRWRGARLGVDGCGRGFGWKMKGSEIGCGRVWTGVWMEDGGERDRVWTGVDGGLDGGCRGARLGVKWCGRGCGWKTEGSETGCGRVWKFKKLRLKQLQMEMIPGERGVDVGGQRPCTKHVSG